MCMFKMSLKKYRAKSIFICWASFQGCAKNPCLSAFPPTCLLPADLSNQCTDPAGRSHDGTFFARTCIYIDWRIESAFAVPLVVFEKKIANLWSNKFISAHHFELWFSLNAPWTVTPLPHQILELNPNCFALHLFSSARINYNGRGTFTYDVIRNGP